MDAYPHNRKTTKESLLQNLKYEKKHHLTLLQWKRFVAGEDDLDPSVIGPELQQAWRRCRELGVDPHAKPVHEIATGERLAQLFKDNQTLIDVSNPFLERLYGFLKASKFTVALFDRQGYVLHVLQDRQHEKINLRFNWFPGSRWTQRTAGNTTVCETIFHKKPIELFGTQHYKKRFHGISGASAPIFGPDGDLLGGITLTSLYSGANPHTLGVAVATAQTIQNELLLQKAATDCRAAFARTEIAASLQKATLRAIPEALIAVNTEKQIFVINDQAKKMFSLEGMTLEGQSLEDIFPGPDNSAFLDYVFSHDVFDDMDMRIRSRKGLADYSVTGNTITISSGEVVGRVLVFAGSKRIRSLVTKIIGAKANFRFEDICGQSLSFLHAVEQAQNVSRSASNVLLLGESGTGKDVFAQAIHNASARKNGPYVAVNCAAIPRDLIASEFFGYAEGAFTGSRRGGNAGKFELADGGTIFLDEIAEIPLEIQAVLLRAIEDRQILRLGSGRIRKVDVRIVSATNKDLMDEVRRGSFRKDLYYRLNVFAIALPPLRERTEDIPALVQSFIAKYAAALNKTIAGITPRALDILMQHLWPGNVRELQNVIERMVNYAEGNLLTPEIIPQEIISAGHPRRRVMDLESPQQREKKTIEHMLKLKFRKKQIAQQLNISRTTLFRRLRDYGLKAPT